MQTREAGGRAPPAGRPGGAGSATIDPISGVAQIETRLHATTRPASAIRSAASSGTARTSWQPMAEAGPLGQFDLSQLEVVAVVWRTGNARALVEDPSGESYIVGEGAAIGKNRGHVISIDDNTVDRERNLCRLPRSGNDQGRRDADASERGGLISMRAFKTVGIQVAIGGALCGRDRSRDHCRARARARRRPRIGDGAERGRRRARGVIGRAAPRSPWWVRSSRCSTRIRRAIPIAWSSTSRTSTPGEIAGRDSGARRPRGGDPRRAARRPGRPGDDARRGHARGAERARGDGGPGRRRDPALAGRVRPRARRTRGPRRRATRPRRPRRPRPARGRASPPRASSAPSRTPRPC